jgi:hypothetical protein
VALTNEPDPAIEARGAVEREVDDLVALPLDADADVRRAPDCEEAIAPDYRAGARRGRPHEGARRRRGDAGGDEGGERDERGECAERRDERGRHASAGGQLRAEERAETRAQRRATEGS